MEIRPDATLIWKWDQPVGKPDAAQMHEDAGTSLDQTEGGHELGGAREGAASFYFHHTQDGRDESAGMANADPEHGIDQEDAPVGRAVHTSNTEAIRNQVIPRNREAGEHQKCQNAGGNPIFPRGGMHGLENQGVHFTTRPRVMHQLLARVFVLPGMRPGLWQ